MQSNLIDRFIEFLSQEENIKDKQAEKFINLTRNVVANISDNKAVHNQRMSELFYRSKQNMPATIHNKEPQGKTMSFTSDEFGEKKIPTQPAPVADSEIKVQESKEPNPLEKDIFTLYNLGPEKAEQEYKTIEGFVSYAISLNCEFTKPPKTFNAAWLIFEKYFRKTMGI